MVGSFCGSRALATAAYRPPLSDDFYDEEGKARRYYYVLDTRGQLFLESTKHRNIATCFKDDKFVRFMFRNMRVQNGSYNELPFLSKCGQELNFITPEDPFAAIVYTNWDVPNNRLYYANNTLSDTFSVHNLMISASSLRIYHEIQDNRHLKGQLGLFHPQLAEQLASSISIDMDGNDEEVTHASITWDNMCYEIKSIE
jgi:hypothetical protein